MNEQTGAERFKALYGIGPTAPNARETVVQRSERAHNDYRRYGERVLERNAREWAPYSTAFSDSPMQISLSEQESDQLEQKRTHIEQLVEAARPFFTDVNLGPNQKT